MKEKTNAKAVKLGKKHKCCSPLLFVFELIKTLLGNGIWCTLFLLCKIMPKAAVLLLASTLVNIVNLFMASLFSLAVSLFSFLLIQKRDFNSTTGNMKEGHNHTLLKLGICSVFMQASLVEGI